MVTKDPQYQIYENNCIALIKTMVIKVDAIGVAMNKYVESLTGVTVSTENKSVWKYYLNLSGQYHAVDTMMSIASLDAEENIDFTVDNLNLNPVTKNAYQYGSSYYNELVAKYPNQEFLILNILNPININTAINAIDGTILAYEPKLIDDQEIDLMDKIQERTYFLFNRWYNYLYTITDSLYLSDMLIKLYMLLIPNVLNIRLSYCKSNQAHSYHVKQYLVSKGLNANDLKYLSTTQMFYLYRNIDYFINNPGKKSVLDELIKILLTDANISIYSYYLHHNVNEINRENLSDITNILPIVNFDKVDYVTGIIKDTVTLDTVNELMVDEAPGNATFISINRQCMEEELTYTKSISYNTKLLETELPTSAITYTRQLSEIMLTEWLMLSSSDVYAVPVEVTFVGASTPTRLTHSQAVALWLYCMLRFYGYSAGELSTLEIPKLIINNCMPKKVPTVPTLKSLYGYNFYNTNIASIQSSIVSRPTLISSQSNFITYCQSIKNMELKLISALGSQTEPMGYSMLLSLIRSIYVNVSVPISGYFVSNSPYQGETWQSLVSQVGSSLSGYTTNDYLTTALDIFTSATGINNYSELEQVNKQTALVNILKTLISYTTMIVNQTVSSVPINVGPTPLLSRNTGTIASELSEDVIIDNLSSLSGIASIINNKYVTQTSTLGTTGSTIKHALTPKHKTIFINPDIIIPRHYIDFTTIG